MLILFYDNASVLRGRGHSSRELNATATASKSYTAPRLKPPFFAAFQPLEAFAEATESVSASFEAMAEA